MYAKSANDFTLTRKGEDPVVFPGFRCRKCAYEFSTYVECVAPSKAAQTAEAQDTKVGKAFRDTLAATGSREDAIRAMYAAQGRLKPDGTAGVAVVGSTEASAATPRVPSRGENDEWHETNPLFHDPDAGEAQ